MAAVSTRVPLEVPWLHQSLTAMLLAAPEFYRHGSSFHQRSTGSSSYRQCLTAMLLAAPEFYRHGSGFHQRSTGSSLWQRQWQRWAIALAEYR